MISKENYDKMTLNDKLHEIANHISDVTPFTATVKETYVNFGSRTTANNVTLEKDSEYFPDGMQLFNSLELKNIDKGDFEQFLRFQKRAVDDILRIYNMKEMLKKVPKTYKAHSHKPKRKLFVCPEKMF